jgi:hypothetical protein
MLGEFDIVYILTYRMLYSKYFCSLSGTGGYFFRNRDAIPTFSSRIFACGKEVKRERKK